MPSVSITISNKLGLHARAAAKLTQLAGRYSSEIFIARGSQRVNAKSIMGVMMLAAGMGVTVVVDAQGDDADQSLNDIQALFDAKFGDNEKVRNLFMNSVAARTTPSDFSALLTVYAQ